jgi:hypothetical protein
MCFSARCDLFPSCFGRCDREASVTRESVMEVRDDNPGVGGKCVEEGYVDAPIDLLSWSIFINILYPRPAGPRLSLYRTFPILQPPDRVVRHPGGRRSLLLPLNAISHCAAEDLGLAGTPANFTTLFLCLYCGPLPILLLGHSDPSFVCWRRMTIY